MPHGDSRPEFLPDTEDRVPTVAPPDATLPMPDTEPLPGMSARERLIRVGDFSVSERDLRRAEDAFAERSARSRGVDRAFRGPIPADYETWRDNPRRFDFPGVDTPTERPRRALSDFPTPEGRRRMADQDITAVSGGIGVTADPAPLEGVLGEKDAALDSLAGVIEGLLGRGGGRR